MSYRNKFARAVRTAAHLGLYQKYRDFTMASRWDFWRNMLVVDQRRHVQGCVVECGVWRGGMSAGMAEVLGPVREYFLFDSFEGLPPAGERDGENAKRWQEDASSPGHYDNCRAAAEFADRAMQLSATPKYRLIKGWFNDTLKDFVPPSPIAVLRLDGDWYESTMLPLTSLWKYMARGGIAIIDDYYAWDGCSQAVHDFLSRNCSTARIRQIFGLCVVEPRQ